MKVLDLFCGIGGITQAFLNNDCEIVCSNDFDKHACSTYRLNYPDHNIIEGDITQIREQNLPSHDILAGGFPCQAFSIAGKQEGFNDSEGRGNLFFDMIRITKYHKPKAIIMENVKNVKTHDRGRTFKIMKEMLEDNGYHVRDFILNSRDFGLPQNRERIFIISFLDKSACDKFVVPVGKATVTLDSVIDFSDKKDDKYYYGEDSKYHQMISESLPKYGIGQIRRIYFRVNKKNICPTLTANMGTGGHNVPLISDDFGYRKLTPRECVGLQGFDMDNFKFPDIGDCHLYKQAGNSVSIPVVDQVVKNTLKVLK